MVAVDDVKPYEKNAKRHPKGQVEKIAKSIAAFGFNQPLVLNKDMVLIVGHGRLEAAKKLGMEKVPALILDIEEKKAKAYRLADNKLNESPWDMQLVIEELRILAGDDFDISLTGFDEDLVLSIAPESGEIPSVPSKPKAKLGDIYQLGDHRVMCGDSLDSSHVSVLMNGQLADLAHNDPPYGMKKEKLGVKNDNLNYSKLLEFNREWIANQLAHLKENASWYCWGTDEPLMSIYGAVIAPLISEQRATFRNLITWDKGSTQGQKSENLRMFPVADEKCLFMMMGVQGFNNNSDNYFDAWEPLRAYLEEEIKKIGLSDLALAKAIGFSSGRTVNHWYSKSQWSFISQENHLKLVRFCKKNKIEALKKDYEALKKDYEALKKDYFSTRAYFDNNHDNMNNVWHFERCLERAGGHATPKPVDLCERVVKSSCPLGGLVVDFFGGSGSTLIACERTGRTCFIMELEPRYVDVIVKRWENLTGKKALKL